jgi:uncharacterized iron-regulated membrane protein
VKESLRQSMAALHTWTGVLLGWLLFAMFAAGTAAYFQDEITRWMQPEVTSRATPERAAQAAVTWLEAKAPDAKSWFITPPGKRSATTQVFWQPAERQPGTKRGETSAVLDGDGYPVSARETRGGFFLYRFHFDLHYMPVIWARYLVGIAAMFMLVAILSGIVTHKKIFADFFLLRFGKGQRSWLDAHNVTAVLALPFHLMITYTGLVTLATLYMPFGIAANYAKAETFFEAVFPQGADAERSGTSAPLAAIPAMMRVASAEWGGKSIGFVRVVNPGDRKAVVIMTQASSEAIGARGETLRFDGATGRRLGASPSHGGGSATESVMIGLHAGRYSDYLQRWLYFASGLFGTAMVGTGLVLWTAKRKQRQPDPSRPYLGFRIVDRLNIAVIAGFPAGIASYFLSNRLLPPGLANRAEWEIHCLFIAWAAMLVWAIARPSRPAWIEGLAATALLFGAVPIANLLTTSRGITASLAHGDWLFVTFDLVMMVFAGAFALGAWKVRSAKVVSKERSRAAKGAGPVRA